MKKYTALFATDVPHYGFYDIEAADDEAAIDAARALYNTDSLAYDDPEWENVVCARIVHIADPDGKTIAYDIPLDDFFVRGGGEADRLLWDNAADMLGVLECAIETEEGNWDGPDDEPDWLRQARVVTAKATGTVMSVKDNWNMACPACGFDNEIDIAATVCVRLCPDGTDVMAAVDRDHLWDGYSTALCYRCRHIGTVNSFTIDVRGSQRPVAYPVAADNVSGPLGSRL